MSGLRLAGRVLGAAALLLCRPSPAIACSCASEGFSVTPGKGDTVPLNTRVWVAIDNDVAREAGVAAASRLRDGSVLTLRLAGAASTGPQGEVVPVSRRLLGDGGEYVVELSPAGPLRPRTGYVVVLSARARQDKVLGQFQTADHLDQSPPRWKGVLKSAYLQPRRVCCNCSTGDPYAVLDLGEAADEGTNVQALRYAIWVAGPGGRIDYHKPPRTYGVPWSERLMLGHSSICSAANFSFPRGASRVRLGLRAVDLAGNLSEPSEVELDLSHPGRERR